MYLINEAPFFARDEIYARGLDWYKTLFDGATDRQLCGVKSTSYTKWPQYPHVAERIADALPDVKLIYIMRHPIDRAYSHYLHRRTKELYKGQPIDVSFEEHVLTDPMCIDGSDYMQQIAQYLAYYSRDSMLFLFSDDLRRYPQDVLDRVCCFLGIEEPYDMLADGIIVSGDSVRHRKHAARKRIVARLKAIPGLHTLVERFPRSWRNAAYSMWRRTPYGKRIERRLTPPPMRPDTRLALLERYRESNRQLEDLLGIDLSHWND